MGTAQHGVGMPGWVELSVTDLPAAQSFYSQLLGWTFQELPGGPLPYYIIFNKDRVIGGLTGKWNEYQPTQWLTYLQSDNIDASIEAINSSGGKTYMPPTDIPGGKFTVASGIADEPFGVVQSEGFFEAFGDVGDLIWFELQSTKDVTATVDFYRAVFGWKTSVLEDMPYVTFGLKEGQENQVGGVYSAAGDDFPGYLDGQAQWAVTFHVSDVQAVADAAVALGGQSLSIDKGTPYGDFAMFRDPQGAFFVVMTPTPH